MKTLLITTKLYEPLYENNNKNSIVLTEIASRAFSYAYDGLVSSSIGNTQTKLQLIQNPIAISMHLRTLPA